jgi:hypothetical protein
MMIDEPTGRYGLPSGRQGPTAPAFQPPQNFPQQQQIPGFFTTGEFQVPSQSRAAESQLPGSYPTSNPMPRSTVTTHNYNQRRYRHRRDMSQDQVPSTSRMSTSPPFPTSTMYSPTHTQQVQNTLSRQFHPYPYDARQYSPPTNSPPLGSTYPTPITMPATQLSSYPSGLPNSNAPMNHLGQSHPPSSSSQHSFQPPQQR